MMTIDCAADGALSCLPSIGGACRLHDRYNANPFVRTKWGDVSEMLPWIVIRTLDVTPNPIEALQLAEADIDRAIARLSVAGDVL